MVTVQELLAQSHSLGETVQIIIGDNGEDNADFSQISGGNLKITHRIHSRNLGLGGNLEWLLSNAQGDFTWLLSDDDEVLSGALSDLLQYLSTLPPCDVFPL